MEQVAKYEKLGKYFPYYARHPAIATTILNGNNNN